jgi:phosphoglycerol transferase MdoB-like AlkP superfamily enzyme
MLKYVRAFLFLLLFWLICFDISRIFFSIHHSDKVFSEGLVQWFSTFVHSFRLDLATAAALSVLPILTRIIDINSASKWSYTLFNSVLGFLIVILIFVQAGESVAYSEWNHKLTSRVFMHLGNPDEVARTADYSMIVYFTIHAILRGIIFIWIARKMFPRSSKTVQFNFKTGIISFASVIVLWAVSFLILRGPQPIPLNTDSAAFSNKAALNDLSINSLYYFGKSYLLYNRSDIDAFMPKTDIRLAKKNVEGWYNYPQDHDQLFLENKKPNVVFIIFEGWSAAAMSSLSRTQKSTPNFDKLAKQGVLFTNIYATATTSENGNSSIFSGNPVIPEISISMQPEKHRKLNCLNEDFESNGYQTGYLFSGDLNYGNIGSYFKEHGFDVVKDELDFPKNLKRGRLNFFDRDLYSFLIKEINSTNEPFLQCAFTGSTHSPYDQPKAKRGKPFKGDEAAYMNALVYADECLGDFIQTCKNQPWYKNTLFVFISDHGHPTPGIKEPSTKEFYRIPMLFFGEPIKSSYRGKKMNQIGSQADLAATLIYQVGGNPKRYPYSKDLMNPKAPKYAFHSIINGYGWITEDGNFTYNFELKRFFEQTYTAQKRKQEFNKCAQFLNTIYQSYKML